MNPGVAEASHKFPLILICLALLQLPILFEIVLQIRLQALLLTEVPAAIRAKLPPFPRGHKTILFSSIQFQTAFWEYLKTENASDTFEASDLKKRIRHSLHRKGAFFTIDIIALSFFAFYNFG